MSTANHKAKSPEEKLAARKALEAAEKAEVMQALMSLYIPLSLFIACCIFAAGVFMVYYEEPAGWGFIATTLVLALSAFLALFKFQNKFRAKGIIPTRDTIVESNIVDANPEASSEFDSINIDTTSNGAKFHPESGPESRPESHPGPSPALSPARGDGQVTAAK
jgi:hypothetical protein